MRRAVLTYFAVAVIACGSQSNHPAPLVDPTASKELVSGNAARYNDPTEAPPSTPVGDAIVAATRDLAEHMQKPVPVADARLFSACKAIARVTPSDGAISYGAIEFAFQSNGIIEPSPHLLVVHGDLQDPDSIVATARAAIGGVIALEPIARIGVGTWDGRDGGTMVIALLESHLDTSPIPRSLAAAAHASFDLHLADGYRDPQIRITQPTGQPATAPLRSDARGFHATIDCAGATGTLQIEVHADGPSGPGTLANFPVWCGEAPPPSMDVEKEAHDLPATPGEAERRVFALLNQERERAGIPPLVWDDELAQATRAHSEEMARLGMVADDLPTIGNVAAHVHRARHGSVARAYGVAELARGLMGMPSVRAPIVSASMTHIGIGIAYGREVGGGMREAFVTTALSP